MKITNWNEHYENAQSRKVHRLAWVPVPNKHDGERYSELMARKDAAEIFSAWILILQVGSRSQCRGSLLRDDGRPHTSESLAIKTRGSVEWFKKAIPYLMQIGWLEGVTEDATSPLPEDSQLTTTPLPSCRARREGKGIERREGNDLEDEVFVTWNSMESLPKVMSLTDKRKKAIKSRMDDEFFSEHWRTALGMIVESSFCTGTNERGWKADLDWFLRPDSVPRIMEGKYANKSTKEKAWNKRLSLEEIEAASESKLQGGAE